MIQQLARHKIFLAGIIKVFITGLKYRWNIESYFSVVNRFTDLTWLERRALLSGESSAKQPEEQDSGFVTDEEADQFLDELIEEQADIDSSHLSLSVKSQDVSQSHRRKRSVSDDYDGDDLFRDRRDLGLADLIRTEKSPKLPEENIALLLSSRNPDYIAPKFNQEIASPEIKDLPEISLQDLQANTAINPDSQTSGSWFDIGLYINPISVIKNTFSDAMGILSHFPSTSNSKDIIVKIDWRRTGCISEPINQGYCASCYAVSSMAFVEWALCRSQGNVLTPLSTQYVVDCGKQFKQESNGAVELDGCNRGKSHLALKFIKEYGLELESHMPYLERESNCPIKPSTPRKHKGFIRPNVRDGFLLKKTTQKLDKALEAGPVLVSMWEPKDFLSYGGGLVDSCYNYGGHSMLIVGSMVEKGEEILLIKNSLGPNWGYNGFFKFRRSAITQCVKQFYLPVLSFPSKKSQKRRAKAYYAAREEQETASDTIQVSIATNGDVNDKRQGSDNHGAILW